MWGIGGVVKEGIVEIVCHGCGNLVEIEEEKNHYDCKHCNAQWSKDGQTKKCLLGGKTTTVRLRRAHRRSRDEQTTSL